MTGAAPSAPAQAPEPGNADPEPDDDQVADDGDQGDDQVPTGTVSEVLAWVGDDPTRAQRAYDAEWDRAQPRSSLLAELVERGAEA